MIKTFEVLSVMVPVYYPDEQQMNCFKQMT